MWLRNTRTSRQNKWKSVRQLLTLLRSKFYDPWINKAPPRDNGKCMKPDSASSYHRHRVENVFAFIHLKPLLKCALCFMLAMTCLLWSPANFCSTDLSFSTIVPHFRPISPCLKKMTPARWACLRGLKCISNSSTTFSFPSSCKSSQSSNHKRTSHSSKKIVAYERFLQPFDTL